MRLVQVVLSLGIGGQERLVVRIARGLQERGHDVHVVTLTRGGALRGELGSVPVHTVARHDGFDPLLYPKLARVFSELAPDVVHTHNAAPLLYAVAAARLAGVQRVVHTKHGEFRYPPVALRLARVATRAVHAFVAVSQVTAAAAERSERARPERLYVIENGIPLGAFGPDAMARASVRRELGIPQDAFVVGSVGRLVPEKDYPLLVRSAASMLGEGMRLVIVGEGDSRPAVEQVRDELGPERARHVILTGARRDVPRVLCAFDVFASSSRSEGLPLAIPEAMASGLPVVATAVGGVPGIVPRSVGMLVAHGDATALHQALRALRDDEAARMRMGAAARAYATERFAEERMLTDYLALYTGSDR